MTDEQAVRLLVAIREHAGLELAAIRDAASYGAAGGFGGFTYYSDTSAFVACNRSLVWEVVAQEADEMGYDNVPAFVASFAMADTADTEVGFDNLLAWYVLEAAGRWLVDRRERRGE